MGFGGAKRAVGRHEDLTATEGPSSRADVQMHVETAGPAGRAAAWSATAALLVGPMAGWLVVCLLFSPGAVFTVATCGGVLLLSFVAVLVGRS